jgi:endonuclease I
MKLSAATKMILRKSPLLPLLYTNMVINTTLEHIIPVSYMRHHIHARDFHNIYATTDKINQLRCNYVYGVLPKSCYKYEDNIICKKNKIFYPRKKDRGIIARSILYMRDKYNYTNFGDIELYEEWNREYKPTKKEIIHNEIGYLIQGNFNKYISNYTSYKNDTIN